MSNRMTLQEAQDQVVEEFALIADWQDRYEQIIESAKDLPRIDPEKKVDANLVNGCQSRVWLAAEQRDGTIHLSADSDALITKGLVALLVRVLNDRTPEEILGTPITFIERIGLREHLSPTRSNGLASMLDQIKRYALAFGAKEEQR